MGLYYFEFEFGCRVWLPKTTAKQPFQTALPIGPLPTLAEGKFLKRIRTSALKHFEYGRALSGNSEANGEDLEETRDGSTATEGVSG